jgi:hypothetical protein
MRKTGSGLAVIALGAVAFLLWSSTDRTESDVAIIPVLNAPDDGGAILEKIDAPTGPFDPVITKPPRNPRFTPPTNVLVNDRDGDTASSVQSETAIWVDGDEIVIGWNDAMGFFGANSLCGVAYSTDRGQTFTDGGELPDGGGIEAFGDPTIVKTNAGTWVYAGLDQGAVIGLAIYRGTFTGGVLNWGAPFKYQDGGDFLDKEFLAYDSENDVIYLTWTNFDGFPDEIGIARSTDDGVTWSAPVKVGDRMNGNGPYPVPGIDGEVYVSWQTRLGGSGGQPRMQIRYSADGGVTWPDPVRVIQDLDNDADESPDCFNRGRNIMNPTCDVDRSNGPFRGRLYASWCDGNPDEFDIYFSYSDDKGVTWTTPRIVNDNGPATTDSEQFFPQLRVSETDGRILVGWYDRRNNDSSAGLCDFYLAQSVDGGEYWGVNRRMSDMSVAWCGVPSDITPNFGDYIAVFVDDRSSFAVWADGRFGNPDVIYAAKDDRFDLSVSGDFGTAAPFAASGTSYPIPDVAEWTATAVSPDTPAQFIVAAIGQGLTATPQEDAGIFELFDEAVTMDITLTSGSGAISGTATMVKSGPYTLDFSFDSATDPSLSAVAFDGSFLSTLSFVTGSGGGLDISGTVAAGVNLGFPVLFSASGTVDAEGGGGSPGLVNFGMVQDATYRDVTGDITLNTRTLIEETVVGIEEDIDTSLGDNPFPQILVGAAPNPWQPSTRISYTIDRPVEGAIRIYSAQGRLVRTLIEGPFAAGDHSFAFDGKDDQGRKLAIGGYFVHFENNIMTAAKKLFVVR